MPSTPAANLTLKQYWHCVGSDKIHEVIDDMEPKTSLRYFRQLTYRQKRPSYDFAQRIIASANKITPGFAPDLDTIMQPLPKRGKGTHRRGGGPIPPSAAFLKSASMVVSA